MLEDIRGNAMELIAEVTTQSAPMVELNVLRSPNKEEFTRIAFFGERGYLNPNSGRNRPDSLITIDSSYSSILSDARSRAPEIAPVFIEPDEPLKLRVFIDKSVVSERHANSQEAPFELAEGEPLRLHIFSDRSALEVFANGRECLTQRTYPTRADSLGVCIFVSGGRSTLKFLDVWDMQPANSW